MVVLDEAYVEFVADPTPLRGLELLASGRTSSCCGPSPRRTGWPGSGSATASHRPELATAVRAVSLPVRGLGRRPRRRCWRRWRPSRSCCERVASWSGRRDRLCAGLRELGFAVPDAQGNFVWLPGRAATTAYADAFAVQPD